jgi:LytR cell envelope-related transcriptional attenuator
MSVLPFAFSLSSSVTEIGAIAAFAALLGIAVLSLLVFSQAREIKRLREWAGRAPERAAEMEQRVSADASARVQRAGAPVAGARVVPRTTPLVSAPVSTAVHATAAAAVPGVVAKGAVGSTATADQSALKAEEQAPASASEDAPPASPSALDENATAGTGPSESLEGTPLPSAPVSPSPEHGVGSSESPEPIELGEVAGVGVSAPGAAEREDLPPATRDSRRATASTLGGGGSLGGEPSAPAPATAAARAAGIPPRPALPPSPTAPAPPGASSSPGAATVPPTVKPASRPPAPVVASRRTPSRVLPSSAAVGGGGAPRSPSPRGAIGGRGAVGAAVGAPLAGSGANGPKYFKPQRSARRGTLLIGGGVVGVALLLVLATSVLKGGGSTPSATRSSASEEAPSTSSHASRHASATNPANTAVIVLNGTGTPHLAHHLASDLQQSGYAHAVATTGVPPGTHATTVVEYARGHRPDARSVAKALNVTQVQAIEATIAPLAGSASVVVLAGADQAALLGGGGTQSKGEPAAGQAGAGEAQAGATGAGAAEGATGTGQ